MRSLVVLLFAAALASPSVHASVCGGVHGAKAPQTSWRVDHYVYDAALRRDWEVLADCKHPETPERIELAPPEAQSTVEVANRVAEGAGQEAVSRDGANRPPEVPVSIKAGTAVEVFSAANARASILLAGTALQTALSGQVIRIRLRPSGRFVTGIVRGPHSVELATAAKPSWGKR